MTPSLSVVVPTFNRKELLSKTLEGLFHQSCPKSHYEIVVIVDGSRDGTCEMLQSLPTEISLRPIFQENRGTGAALNRGIREARGEIILCLDDDILASNDLVLQHLTWHEKERGDSRIAVLGHHSFIPSPNQSPLRRFFEEKYQKSYQRMTIDPASLQSYDLYSGNFSIRKTDISEVGGFNEELGRLALWDWELGLRLWEKGIKFLFNPQAVGYLQDLKGFGERCARCFNEGQALVRITSLHPNAFWELPESDFSLAPFWRKWCRALLFKNTSFSKFLLITIFTVLNKGENFPFSRALYPFYRAAFDYYFWLGVSHGLNEILAEKSPSSPKETLKTLKRKFQKKRIPILAYHRIASDAHINLKRYSIPPEVFKKQINYLLWRGYQPISLRELMNYFQKGGDIPPKPLIITFDDGYRDNMLEALPFLSQKKIPATIFIPTDYPGKMNIWDDQYGGPLYEIMNWDDIKSLETQLFSVQSHGCSHAKLPFLESSEITQELKNSKEILSKTLAGTIDFFCYPHGAWNYETSELARKCGYIAAFTVDGGLAKPGKGWFSINRIPIYRTDSFLSFAWKVATGYKPWPWLKIKLRVNN